MQNVHISPILRRCRHWHILPWLAALATPLTAHAEYPSERALFFQYAAVLADVPELCNKISPTAQYTAGFNPSGYQIYAVRSKCFFDTALRHHHPALCDQVQSVSTPFLSGKKISAENCRARMGSHIQIADPLAPKSDTVLRLFAEMGYTADNATQRLPLKPLFIAEREFHKLYSRPDIQQRVLDALHVSENIPSTDRDVLYDMAGVLTKDVTWCQKIDPAHELNADKSASIPHTTWNMAHWCIFKIAFNADNPTLCELLPKTHEPGLTALYSLAGQCRANITAFHDPKNTTRRGHYGFNPVKDDAQRSRLYRNLGYAEPRDADYPPAETERRFRTLLRDIGSGRIDRQGSQVQALLEKLKSLPE